MAFGAAENRWKVIGAVGAVVGLFAYFMTIAFRRILTHRFSDFNVFYSAAQATLRHGDLYRPMHRSYIYPPLIAFIYAPLALLSEQHAAMIVLCANFIFIVLALLILARECISRLGGRVDALITAQVCLLAVLLIPDKVRDELQMFQTNALMLLMLAFALRWLDKRPARAGIALGLACNIKYLPIVTLPYLLIRRRWTAAGAFVVSCIAFALLPALLWGWDKNLSHLNVALGGLTHMVGMDTAGSSAADVYSMRAGFSLSITSGIARLTHRWRADWLTLPMVLAIAMTCTGIFALMYRRNSLPLLRWPDAAAQSAQPYRALVALEWAALIALALVFSPQTNPRHLVLLLLMTSLLGAMIFVPRQGIARFGLVFAAILLFAGLTFPWGGTLTPLARRSRAWITYSGQGWCILLVAGVFIWYGLKYAVAVPHENRRTAPASNVHPQLALHQLEVA